MRIKYIIPFLVIVKVYAVTPVDDAVQEGADAALLENINRIEAQLIVAKSTNHAEEIAQLQSSMVIAQQQLTVTQQIYSYYQDAMEAIETVSSTIKTYKQLQQFYDNISEIMRLYTEYGVNFSFYSLYDLEAYVDPRTHDRIVTTMMKINEQAAKLLSTMSLLVFNDKTGVKATEYERLKVIQKLNNESRILLIHFKRLVNTMLYLVPPKKRETQANFELKESFFNYKNYAH